MILFHSWVFTFAGFEEQEIDYIIVQLLSWEKIFIFKINNSLYLLLAMLCAAC